MVRFSVVFEMEVLTWWQQIFIWDLLDFPQACSISWDTICNTRRLLLSKLAAVHVAKSLFHSMLLANTAPRAEKQATRPQAIWKRRAFFILFKLPQRERGVFSEHNKCAYSGGRNSEFALIFLVNDSLNTWLFLRLSAIQNSSNQLTKR